MSTTLESRERSEAEILAELAQTRAQMTQTVDELYGRLQPSYIAAQAKNNVKDKAQELKERAMRLLDEAREGKPEAIRTLGIAAAGVATLTTLVIVRIVRSRH